MRIEQFVLEQRRHSLISMALTRDNYSYRMLHHTKKCHNKNDCFPSSLNYTAHYSARYQNNSFQNNNHYHRVGMVANSCLLHLPWTRHRRGPAETLEGMEEKAPELENHYRMVYPQSKTGHQDIRLLLGMLCHKYMRHHTN